jgi:hypothetical protein
LQFDGVYFQKMYSLNVLGIDEENSENEATVANAVQENNSPPEVENAYSQTEIVDSFARILTL